MRCSMKRATPIAAANLVVLVALLLIAVGCSPGQEPPASVATSQSSTIVLAVEGMACEGCADDLRGLLANQAGVAKVEVSFAQSRATIEPSAIHGTTAGVLCDVVHRELSLKVHPLNAAESAKSRS